MTIPEEAFRAASERYQEVLTRLRLAEGGGFKVASQHRRAITAALEAAAPLIQAQALRDTADEWTRGRWADAPRRADRVQERIATARHVTEWLRARADRIEKANE